MMPNLQHYLQAALICQLANLTAYISHLILSNIEFELIQDVEAPDNS